MWSITKWINCYERSLYTKLVRSKQIKWYILLFSGQNQSNLRELKNENHFLKDYIHRLNAASSEYQTMHPPKTLKKEMSVCDLTLLCA